MTAIGQPTAVAASRPAREAPRSDRRGVRLVRSGWEQLARHQIIKHDQRHIVPPPGRRLHDDEAVALQMPPEALGNDLRHDPIGIVDALAALVSQRECYRSGEVVGRPAIDPELMMRMLIVGYCFGIRSERRCARRSPST